MPQEQKSLPVSEIKAAALPLLSSMGKNREFFASKQSIYSRKINAIHLPICKCLSASRTELERKGAPNSQSNDWFLSQCVHYRWINKTLWFCTSLRTVGQRRGPARPPEGSRAAPPRGAGPRERRERPGGSRSDLSDAAPAKLRRCRVPALAGAPALPWDSPLYLPVLRLPRDPVRDGKKGMLLTWLAVGRPHSEIDIFLWSNHWKRL